MTTYNPATERAAIADHRLRERQHGEAVRVRNVIATDRARTSYGYSIRRMEQIHGPLVAALLTWDDRLTYADGFYRITEYGPSFDLHFEDGAVIWISRPGGFDHSGRYPDPSEDLDRARARLGLAEGR